MNEEFFRVLQQQGSCEAGQCNEKSGKWSCDRCRPMRQRGLEKKGIDNGQTDRHTDRRTLRLCDWPGPEGRVSENQIIYWHLLIDPCFVRSDRSSTNIFSQSLLADSLLLGKYPKKTKILTTPNIGWKIVLVIALRITLTLDVNISWFCCQMAAVSTNGIQMQFWVAVNF